MAALRLIFISCVIFRCYAVIAPKSTDNIDLDHYSNVNRRFLHRSIGQLNITDLSPVHSRTYSTRYGTAEIAGGYPASFVVAKHFVSLSIYFKSSSRYYYRCTGSIMGPNLVLTAAHCMEGPSFKFDISYLTLRVGKNSNTGKRYVAKRVSIIKSYNVVTVQNDVAVVLIKGVFKQPYSSVILPGLSYKLPVGTIVYAAGFGRTSEESSSTIILREAKLRYQNFYRCRKGYPYRVHKFWSPRRSICVTAPNFPNSGIASVCNGDSGGPVYTKAGSKITQVGITSTGSPCGKKTSQAWAVNLKTYVPYLVQYANKKYGNWRQVYYAAG